MRAGTLTTAGFNVAVVAYVDFAKAQTPPIRKIVVNHVSFGRNRSRLVLVDRRRSQHNRVHALQSGQDLKQCITTLNLTGEI
jgi:hypothetical protein